VEVVNELYFILVRYQEISDGSGFRLRERLLTTIAFLARISTRASWFVPRDAIVSVKVNASGFRVIVASFKILHIHVFSLE